MSKRMVTIVRSKYTEGYHLQQARRAAATPPAKLAGQLRCAALSMLGILSLGMSLWVGQATGHHGWSGYDSGQTLSLTGTIQESGYEHPHGYVKLTTPDKVWFVVLAPPSRMENRGLPRTMLAVGTLASVVGYPSRSDPNEMRAERITIADKTVELR